MFDSHKRIKCKPVNLGMRGRSVLVLGVSVLVIIVGEAQSLCRLEEHNNKDGDNDDHDQTSEDSTN